MLNCSNKVGIIRSLVDEAVDVTEDDTLDDNSFIELFDSLQIDDVDVKKIQELVRVDDAENQEFIDAVANEVDLKLQEVEENKIGELDDNDNDSEDENLDGILHSEFFGHNELIRSLLVLDEQLQHPVLLDQMGEERISSLVDMLKVDKNNVQSTKRAQ